ncbi:non-canonical purine NTP pyrophosphatase [Bradyrhizobium sp. BR 10289]|uniref:non-canonical purine NTP pyrophosphatase n=1 Tax=Bradyrhizobium sp. BR 10289 TaxID=2749993 RepID=UPI001C65397E|nr:non-canonical purine NTP pyrophosphatase [Bradyrhizobium sp. BR 10289]
MSSVATIVYSTTSAYKKAEVEEICRSTLIATPTDDRVAVGQLFRFEFRDGKPSEPLERDIEEMVRHKAVSAYKNLLVPCIVEHAGLIFADHLSANYPGGLTQPMWDALGAEKFISETQSKGRKVVARAVIGYCDGLSVRCFRGETNGTLAERPAGIREFYWDPIFVPENESMTYAEICADGSMGLKRKIELSQSAKALVAFLEFRLKVGDPLLFP